MFTNTLPLETFRSLMKMHPFHFWQLANEDVPVRTASNLISEYGWQNESFGGRDSIRQAIENAESRLRKELGFAPAPRYVERTFAWPEYFDPRLTYNGRVASDGRAIGIPVPDEGYIQAMGVESLTLLGTVAVTLSDIDGDGLVDTFSCTVATSVIDARYIACYFSSTERYDGSPVGDRWRIDPVRVTFSSGTATIKGPAWLLVKPVRYQGVASREIDPDTLTNYASTIDVYYRHTNPDGMTNETSQGLFTWESLPWPSWAGCCGSPGVLSTDPNAIATAFLRVGIRDAVTGIVFPGQAVYDTENAVWSSTRFSGCRPPDRVTVRLYAGYPTELDGSMSRDFQEIVAIFAAAELDKPTGAQETAYRELYRWQFDMARSQGSADEGYNLISREDLQNPFGTRRGHIYAWNAIKQWKHARGITV